MEKNPPRRTMPAGRAIEAAALMPPAGFPLWCVPCLKGGSGRRPDRTRIGPEIPTPQEVGEWGFPKGEN